MKVSGFTIVRNGIRLGYPLVESICSILPIVDEYVVLVGPSDDGTAEAVRAIGDPKVRIVDSDWNDTVRKDGLFFSILTNQALAECKGDWAFYLQADEVIHEKDLSAIRKAMEEKLGDPQIKAMLLRFRNFHGDYSTFNPYSHRKAVRIVRNDGTVESSGDAVSFALKTDPGRKPIQNVHPENVHFLESVRVFHYSWVKDLKGLVEKTNLMEDHYFGPDAKKVTEYNLEVHKMTRFTGGHPAVMADRIGSFRSPFPPLPNRWLNPKFYAHLMRHGYKR